MTRTQTELLRRALELLHRLVPDDAEPCAVDAPRRCPVAKFAKKFLIRDPANDQTSQELWQYFCEISASGELERLSKAEFLRRLPTVLETIFGVRKAHNVERDGHRVRGFRGVGIRMDAGKSAVNPNRASVPDGDFGSSQRDDAPANRRGQNGGCG